MSDSTSNTHTKEVPSAQAGITISETFTIQQAINEAYTVACQSKVVCFSLEDLVMYNKTRAEEGERITNLSLQLSGNLARIEAILAELDKLTPFESEPVKMTGEKLEVFYAESFRITALSKSLAAWLMEQGAAEGLGELDMDSGDGLELAHLILKSSLAISKAARGVQQ